MRCSSLDVLLGDRSFHPSLRALLKDDHVLCLFQYSEPVIFPRIDLVRSLNPGVSCIEFFDKLDSSLSPR